jgi:hypothetical protein
MDVRRIYDEAYYHFCRADETYERAKQTYPDLYNQVICAQRLIDQEEVNLEYLEYHNLDTTEVTNRLNAFKLDQTNATNILLSYVYPEYEGWMAAKAHYEDARRMYYE